VPFVNMFQNTPHPCLAARRLVLRLVQKSSGVVSSCVEARP
jgi:hypothetical protein